MPKIWKRPNLNSRKSLRAEEDYSPKKGESSLNVKVAGKFNALLGSEVLIDNSKRES